MRAKVDRHLAIPEARSRIIAHLTPVADPAILSCGEPGNGPAHPSLRSLQQ
jgi:hypothetical protein